MRLFSHSALDEAGPQFSGLAVGVARRYSNRGRRSLSPGFGWCRRARMGSRGCRDCRCGRRRSRCRKSAPPVRPRPARRRWCRVYRHCRRQRAGPSHDAPSCGRHAPGSASRASTCGPECCAARRSARPAGLCGSRNLSRSMPRSADQRRSLAASPGDRRRAMRRLRRRPPPQRVCASHPLSRCGSRPDRRLREKTRFPVLCRRPSRGSRRRSPAPRARRDAAAGHRRRPPGRNRSGRAMASASARQRVRLVLWRPILARPAGSAIARIRWCASRVLSAPPRRAHSPARGSRPGSRPRSG